MRVVAILLVFLVFPLTSVAQAKIGVIIPLSSETQVWGEGIKRGLELARSMHPEVFSLVYEDEAFCNSRQALSAAIKLLEQDRVKYLVTGCLNGTKAVQKIARQHGALILSAGLLDEESLHGSDNTVSLSAQIGTEAAYLAKYLNEASLRDVVLFRHDDTFTQEFSTKLRKGLGVKDNVRLKEVTVAEATFPWASELVRAKGLEADAYVLYLGNDELIGFLKAKDQLQDATRVISGYMVESNFDPAKFGSLLEGVVYTYPLFPSENDPGRVDFETRFRRKFGIDAKPTINSYFAYDGMNVLAEALKVCKRKPSDSSCVYNFFTDGMERSGVSGSFAYRADGSIARQFVMKAVRGGQFILRE